MRKIYISGPITGTTDYMERYDRVEKTLVRLGYSVINPARTNATLPEGTTHDEYMEVSMALLSICDEIYMMQGWKDSLG